MNLSGNKKSLFVDRKEVGETMNDAEMEIEKALFVVRKLYEASYLEEN